MLPSAGVFEPQNLRTFELQWCYLRRGKVAPPTPYSRGPRLQQGKTPGNWNHWRSLVFVLGSSPQIWQPWRIGSDLRDPSTSCEARQDFFPSWGQSEGAAALICLLGWSYSRWRPPATRGTEPWKCGSFLPTKMSCKCKIHPKFQSLGTK